MKKICLLWLSAAWNCNVPVLKNLLPKIELDGVSHNYGRKGRDNLNGRLLTILRSKASSSAAAEKIMWGTIATVVEKKQRAYSQDDCAIFEMVYYHKDKDLIERILEHNTLNVLCTALSMAIKENSYYCTEMIACHVKGKIIAPQANISFNDWQSFVSVLNDAIINSRKNERAFKALIKSECLNTVYLADDGSKFSVLGWIEQKQKFPVYDQNYHTADYQRINLIRLYTSCGVKNIIEDTEGTYHCTGMFPQSCVIL